MIKIVSNQIVTNNNWIYFYFTHNFHTSIFHIVCMILHGDFLILLLFELLCAVHLYFLVENFKISKFDYMFMFFIFL